LYVGRYPIEVIDSIFLSYVGRYPIEVIDGIFLSYVGRYPIEVIDGVSFCVLVITPVRVIDSFSSPVILISFVPRSGYVHRFCICNCIAGIHIGYIHEHGILSISFSQNWCT